MLFHQSLAGAAAVLVTLVAPAAAFVTACEYQGYKCGSTLVAADGYNSTELTTAANATATLPQLDTFQLMDVLYRCINVDGDLVGNSYCIAGCISMPGVQSDQCAM